MISQSILQEVGVSLENFGALGPEKRREFALGLSKFLLKAAHPDRTEEGGDLFKVVNEALSVMQAEQDSQAFAGRPSYNEQSFVRELSLQEKWGEMARTISQQIGCAALRFTKDGLRPSGSPTVLSARPLQIELSNPGTFLLLHQICRDSNRAHRIAELPKAVRSEVGQALANIEAFDHITHNNERFAQTGGLEDVLRRYTKKTMVLHMDETIEISGVLEQGVFKEKVLIGTCGRYEGMEKDLDFLDRVVPGDFHLDPDPVFRGSTHRSPSRTARHILIGENEEGESGIKQRTLNVDEMWWVVRHLSMELKKRHYLFSFNYPAGVAPFYRYEGVIEHVATPNNDEKKTEGV